MPALSALADIAAALGADVAAFFPADEAPRVRVSRAGDPRRIRIEQDPTTEYNVLANRGCRIRARGRAIFCRWIATEDVPVAVELRGGGPVSELSQAGVAATSGAAVAVGV